MFPTRLPIKLTAVVTFQCVKTREMLCLHCCWWLICWCHSYVTPVTTQRFAA